MQVQGTGQHVPLGHNRFIGILEWRLGNAGVRLLAGPFN